MKITIVGTGYVGLVSGACFASVGNRVTCVDLVAEKISSLNKGELPFFEPGLAESISGNLKNGSISFTTDLGPAVSDANVVIIAVGTPSTEPEGEADLSFVFEAVRQVVKHLKHGSIIVIKSTVPIGANRQIEELAKTLRRDIGFDVVSNPEFLREGTAITDFIEPDRIIVGAESIVAIATMEELYRPLTSKGVPILFADFETAETIKYAANAFLATKISFINEIAGLCDFTGADIIKVSKGMGLDLRIGDEFLNAGPGYGGSCFPKDTKALAFMGRQHGAPQHITEAVIAANEEAKNRVFRKIDLLLNQQLEGRLVAVLGVTFKPNTDDMREAPSLSIISKLLRVGVKVHVVDPEGRHFGEELLAGVDWYDEPYDAAANADLVVILTDWDEFKNLDLSKLSASMKSPYMLDCRNTYAPTQATSCGFDVYCGNGRNSSTLYHFEPAGDIEHQTSASRLAKY